MTTLTPQLLLQSRMADGSRRGDRRDQYHLALVLEGGGLRGVVSVGMAAGFEDLGLLRCFDSIHGSSAGACGGAYFAAGQARYGGAVYYEDINNRRFVNYFRPLVGGPIMDTQFLIRDIMQGRKPLEIEKILEQPGFMNITITSAEDGRAVVVNTFRSKSHFFDVLNATIFLPLIAGTRARVDNEMFLDGGLRHQIAIDSAERAGATHVIVAMTRKAGDIDRRDRSKGFSLEGTALGLFYGRKFETVFRERNVEINRLIEQIRAGTDGRDLQLDALVRPSTAVDIDRLTIDGAVLKRGFDEGVDVAAEYARGRRCEF